MAIIPNQGTDPRLVGTEDLGAFTGSPTGSLGEKLQDIKDDVAGVEPILNNLNAPDNYIEQIPSGGGVLTISGASAFGARASSVHSTDAPIAVQTQSNGGTRLHPSGNWVAWTITAAPGFRIAPFTNGSGFGTPVDKPSATPAGTRRGIEWHPSGNYILLHTTTSPYLFVFPFNSITGVTGEPIALAETPPTVTYVAKWSPNGEWLALTHALHNSVNYMTFIPFVASSGTWGTPIRDTMGTQSVSTTYNTIDWHPSGRAIATSKSTTEATRAHIRLFNNDTGVTSSPVSIGTGWSSTGIGALILKFSNNGKLIYMRQPTTTPFVSIHPYNVDTHTVGTVFAAPAAIDETSDAVIFSTYDNLLFVSSTTTPFIYAHPLSQTAILNRIADAATNPIAAPTGLVFDQDREVGANFYVSRTNTTGYFYPITVSGSFYPESVLSTLKKVRIIRGATGTVLILPDSIASYEDHVRKLIQLYANDTYDNNLLLTDKYVYPDNENTATTIRIINSGIINDI